MRAPRIFRRGVRRGLSGPRRASANSNVGQPKTLTQGSTQSRRSPQDSYVGRSKSTSTSRRRAGLTGKANINPNLSKTQKAFADFAKKRREQSAAKPSGVVAQSKSNGRTTQNSQMAKANRSMAKANATRSTPPRATPQKPVRSVDPVRKMPTRSKPPRATPQTPKRSVDPIRKPTIGKPATRKPKFTGHSGSGPRGGLPALKKPTTKRRSASRVNQANAMMARRNNSMRGRRR